MERLKTEGRALERFQSEVEAGSREENATKN
jgi:hypothetical protein